MSETLPSCRREEIALCNPHRSALKERAPTTALQPAETSEKQFMSEKQFLRDHSLYSAMSSWLFAIAGATNIGVLGVLSSKILMAVEKNQPIFKSNNIDVKPVLGNPKYNYITLAMMAFGGVCMAASNWLESKKVVTEWRLGAGKLQRKVSNAENEQVQMTPAPSKNWVASVQQLGDNFAERKKTLTSSVAAIE